MRNRLISFLVYFVRKTFSEDLLLELISGLLDILYEGFDPLDPLDPLEDGSDKDV